MPNAVIIPTAPHNPKNPITEPRTSFGANFAIKTCDVTTPAISPIASIDAHYQNVTFVLLKNGSPFAQLGPDNEKVCLGRHLAEALAGTELPAAEAKAWGRDLRAGRKVLRAPSSKWQ